MTTAQDLGSVYEKLEELLAEGPRELIRLTDEELVAADPLTDDARVAVTPYLDTITDEETRQLVVACGMRALVSRGAVTVDDMAELRRNVADAAAKGAGDVTFDLRYAADLDLALNLRVTADKIVVVEQLSAGNLRDWHYVYVHGDRCCLQEAVTAAGQRTYTLFGLEQQRRQLISLTDPLGNAATDSEPQRMDADAVANGEAGQLAPVLESSRLVTQMMELFPKSDTTHGRLSATYLTDDALWLVESDPASDSETVAVRTLSPDGLSRLIDGVVRA